MTNFVRGHSLGECFDINTNVVYSMMLEVTGLQVPYIGESVGQVGEEPP